MVVGEEDGAKVTIGLGVGISVVAASTCGVVKCLKFVFALGFSIGVDAGDLKKGLCGSCCQVDMDEIVSVTKAISVIMNVMISYVDRFAY